MESLKGYIKNAVALLAAACIFYCNVGVYAQEPQFHDVTHTLNRESRKIDIAGRISPASEQKIVITVVGTAAVINNSNARENVFGLDAVTSDASGRFASVIYLPKNAPETWYAIKIGAAQSVSDAAENNGRMMKFEYISMASEAVKAMNDAADDAGVAAALEGYFAVYEIILDADYTENKSKAAEALYLLKEERRAANATGFKTTDEVMLYFKKAVGFAMLSNIQNSDINYVLTKYGAALELQSLLDDGDYMGNKAEAQTILAVLIKDAEELRIHDMALKLKTAIAIAKINNTGSGEMTAVLMKYNDDVLALDLSGKYSRLGGNTIEVNKALTQKGFTSLKQIRAAFEKRLAEVSVPDTSKSGVYTPSRPGSGGTAGKNILIIPPEEIEPPKEQPDQLFYDLDSVPWAQESIHTLAARGVLSGSGNGAFRPSDNVTREEFIKIIIEAFHLKDTDYDISFQDVPQDSWYHPFLLSAAKIGIVKGIDNTSFGVGMPITRQDMSVIIYRTAAHLGIDLEKDGDTETFADSDKIAPYAAESVKALHAAGLINGVGDHLFAPENNLTRAEAAHIIYKISVVR